MEIQPCTDRRQSLLNLKQQSSGSSGNDNSQIPFLHVANPVPPNLQSMSPCRYSLICRGLQSLDCGAQSIWNVCGFKRAKAKKIALSHR